MKRILGIGLLLLVPGWAVAGDDEWVITARDTTSGDYAAGVANGEIGVTGGWERFSLGAGVLGGG